MGDETLKGAPQGVTFEPEEPNTATTTNQTQPTPQSEQQPQGAPRGVTFDMAKKPATMVQPTGAPQGVTFDMAKPAQKAASATEYPQAATQATGISARRPEAPDVNIALPGMGPGVNLKTMEKFHSWLEDVQADVANGTDATWVGSVLKRLGAKGTHYGVSEQTGDFMAGPLGGVPKALEAIPRAGEGHPVQAVNKAVAGTFQSLGPTALVTAPGALAVVVPSMVVQNLATQTAKHFGLDDDYAELFGNIASIGGGVAVHSPLEMAEFENAMNNHMSSETQYQARLREMEIARQQAEVANTFAIDMAKDEIAQNKTGNLTPEQKAELKQRTDTARSTASEATANANKAQKAFEMAGEERAETGQRVKKFSRRIQNKYEKARAKAEEAAKTDAQNKMDAMRKAIPAKKNDAFFQPNEETGISDYDRVRAHLDEAKEQGKPTETIRNVRDAAEEARQGIEDKIEPYIEKYGDEELTPEGQESPKQKVVAKLEEMAKIDGNFEGADEHLADFNVTNPTVREAQSMLTQLNNHLRSMKQSANNWDTYNMITTNPKFAAYFMLADELREGLFNRLEGHGVEGIRDARADTKALVDFRNMADAQLRRNAGATTVRGSAEAGKTRQLLATVLGKATKAGATALGAHVAGTKGAVVGSVLGEQLGGALEDYIAPGDATRDEHVAASMKGRGTNRKTPVIGGEGTPADVPNYVPPPPVKVVAPEVSLTPRENTRLHSDLAAHAVANLGAKIADLPNVPYSELESNFLQYIQDKIDAGLEPTTKEAGLLERILEANVADEGIKSEAAKTTAQRQAAAGEEREAEVERTLQEAKDWAGTESTGRPLQLNPTLDAMGRGNESALVSHPASPEMIAHSPVMRVAGLPEGIGQEDAFIHDWSHIAMGAIDGLKPEEMRSDLHPKAQKGAGITAVFNAESLMDENGNVDPEALKKAETQWLSQKMAGPVSHEVFGGMTREEAMSNRATARDVRQARAIVRAIHPDYSPAQVEEAVNAAYNRVRGFLSKPHIADRIRANAAVRENNLPQTLHASNSRVTQFAEDIRKAHNDYTGNEPRPDGTTSGEGGEKAENAKPGGEEKNEGRNSGGREEKPRPVNGEPENASGRTEVAESAISKEAIPKERTTGNPEVDEAIRQGGGIPGGVQKGFDYVDKATGETRSFPDTAYVHEPKSGTSLNFPMDQITPEFVKERLEAKRAEYKAAGQDLDKLDESAIEASPEMKREVAKSKWTGNDYYRSLETTNKLGEGSALMYQARPEDGGYGRVIMSQVDPEMKGQGIGKEMYRSMIEDAKARGLKGIKSDTSVSKEAQRVWDSLRDKDGLPITRRELKPGGGNGGRQVEYTLPFEKAAETPEKGVSPRKSNQNNA